MTGTAILTKSASGIMLAVEVAFGANLTDLTGNSWTWTDITPTVLMSNGVAGHGDIDITVGRQDESSTTNPATMTCVLDNRSGNYSQGGGSNYWPYIRRNTPVRVRVSTNSGNTWTVKFQGGAISWQPVFDPTGQWATVKLTAAGPLRQLNQGSQGATSYYAQTIPTSSLFPGLQYYWNNEVGNGSEGSNGISVCYPTVPSGVVSPTDPRVLTPVLSYLPQVYATTNTTAFPISGPVPAAWDFATNYSVGLPATTSTGALQFRFLCAFSSLATTATQPLVYWNTSASATLGWAIYMNQNGDLWVQNGTNAPANNGYVGTNVGFGVNGKAFYVQMQMITNGTGSTIRLDAMSFDGTSGGYTWNATGSTTGYLTNINWVGPNINTTGTPIMQGHLTVQNTTQSIATLASFYRGNPGESVSARLVRIANQANIAVQVLSSSAAETSANAADIMGSQYYDTVSNLLRECEVTGQGFLVDGLGQGLTYVTRQLRESQQATLTLDASAGDLAVSFEPIDDDQRTINNVTVTRRNGSSFTFEDLTGDLGVNSVGDYQSSVTINSQDDTLLAAYAQWLVHLGTLPGYRYPTITFALDSKPSKIAAWLAMIPTGRLDIANITALRPVMPQGTIRNIVEGWTETINAYTWRVTCNCTPWQGWNVGTMAASTGTTVDTVMRRDTDGSQVNTAAAVGATTVSVKLTATGKPLWTTAADDFPLIAEIGGMAVTVTGISGSSSPQTFTLASPGLPFAAIVGDQVRLWNPPVPGL